VYLTRAMVRDRRPPEAQYPNTGWRYPKTGALLMPRNLCDNSPVPGAGHPSGRVGPVGANRLPFMGMDPSDPVTYVRPYNPAPGMIAQLNFDGARPAPAGGVQRGKQPRLWWPGGVAGSSVRNG
jgi:hypothetical protein